MEDAEKLPSGEPNEALSGDTDPITGGERPAEDAEVVAPENPGPTPTEHVPNPERLYPKRPGGAWPAGWMKVRSGAAEAGSSPDGEVPAPRVVKKALPPLILPPAGELTMSAVWRIMSAAL